MNGPRYRLLIAGLLLGLPALFVPIRWDINTKFWERLMDACHPPFFFAATLWLYVANPLGLVKRRQRLTFTLATVAAAIIAVELVQGLTGREASLVDFRNGFAGFALAAVPLAWPAVWRTRGAAIGYVLVAAAALWISAMPAWREGRSMRWRAENFPLLADFETETEMPLWRHFEDSWDIQARLPTRRTTDAAASGKWSLQVNTDTSPYPGARLYLAGQDWRGRTALVFDVLNPGAPFTLGLRINDADSPYRPDQRFNRALPLDTGWNRVRIPLAEIERSPHGRLLNLSRIHSIYFFLDHPRAPHAFHLDHVRLE